MIYLIHLPIKITDETNRLLTAIGLTVPLVTPSYLGQETPLYLGPYTSSLGQWTNCVHQSHHYIQ
jgi:hypothetical protein